MSRQSGAELACAFASGNPCRHHAMAIGPEPGKSGGGKVEAKGGPDG